MHLRPLLAVSILASLAAQALPARADAWRPPFVEPYAYFTEDAQYEAWYALRAGLELGFEDICGDTFCEGDYSNIAPLRFQCSVQLRSGRIGACTWSFAASNEEIDAGTGQLAVDVPAWTCSIALAPGVTMTQLLVALAVDEPLFAPLPGGTDAVYDSLVDCL
jgi:hypothetical protein